MSRVPRQVQSRRPALRSPLLVVATAALLIGLAGCGSSAESGHKSGGQDSSDSVTIDITIKDRNVKPSGSKVDTITGIESIVSSSSRLAAASSASLLRHAVSACFLSSMS